MQSLLFVLTALSGSLSHESIREPQAEEPWVHHRSRLYLLSKSEDEPLGDSRLLWSYEASGFLQYDSVMQPGERTEFRLENLLMQAYQGEWNARFGWQTINWGETLGPSLIDVLNPRDLRDPSYWIRGDQKLAVPLLLVGWSRESTTVDVWGSPYTPASLLPAEWQDVELQNSDNPRTAEFGLRAGDRLAGWDMKFYAMRHRSRMPALTFDIQNPEPVITASFPMQTSLGFTVSQAWDTTVLRSEFVHADSDDWPSGSLLDLARDQAVVGLDGSWGDHFFWGSEFRYSHQRSAQVRDRELGWAIVQGQWNLWNERVKPLIHLMQRAQHHDAYQRYEISGTLKDAWQLGLSWEAFQSGTRGYFTRLQANDRLGLNIRWEF